MARQAGNGRSVGSVRNPSGGAAVLDRPEHDAPEMHAKDLLQEEIQRLVEASRAGRLSERGRVERFEGNDRTLVEGVNTMLDAILLPIGEGNRVLAQISAGKIDELITQTYSGDHEKMKQAVNNVAVVLQGLQKELGRLTEASKEGQLSERGKPDQFQGAYASIVKGFNDMLDAILLPIGEGNRILAQISNGRIDELIAQTYKGDHEKMKQAVNNVAAALQNMAKDVSLLVQAMLEGKLAVRADAAKHQGDFRKVIEGFNLTLDNVIKPLNVSAEYVDRISKGDIPPKITDAYQGDFNEIKNNLNVCIDALSRLVADGVGLTQSMLEGKLAVRADAAKHQGDFKKVIEGFNLTLDNVIKPLNVSAEYVDRISKGDIPPKITDTYQGDFNEIKNNLNVCIDALSRLVSDGVALTQSMLEGKLAVRADAAKHQGDFKKVLEGFNLTLDNVIKPLNMSAEYMDRISKGDIPPKITDTYQGDFNEVKNNLNVCIDAIGRLVTDGVALTKSKLEGKLASRADTTHHQGDFKKVLEGFNLTLDNVIKPLNMSAEYMDRISKGDIPPKITDTYQGDFNEVKNNLNVCIDAIGRLVADGVALTQSMLEGKLAARADAAQHHGDFKKILEGFNLALDNVIKPLNVSAEYMDRISKGDIPPKITDTYQGDFNEVKNNLNVCIDAIGRLVADGVALTQSMLEGKLAARADAAQHHGDFKKILEGFNLTLDAILHPIGEGNRVLTLIRGGNLRERVEIACKGDHEKMKNAINGVQTWLTDLIAYLTKLANGDMTAAMDKASSDDQIHEWLMLLKNNINGLADDVNTLAQASANGKLGVRAEAARHRGEYRKIVEGFNKTLDIVVDPLKIAASQASSLASSAEELTAVSNQMASNAEETATQANVVSAASEEVSKNVTVVATGSEQMQASIREISKSANESAKVAKAAVGVAETTNSTIAKLGESSVEIGKVIKVITSIAQQTNLLALNATIEAARAGEAGKGFAVVANEVKELAKETAKATEEIGQKIDAIQTDTKGAVQAIGEISAIINQINDISNNIASAVEEQTVTTNEIARNVAEAAKGTGEIAKNIGGVDFL